MFFLVCYYTSMGSNFFNPIVVAGGLHMVNAINVDTEYTMACMHWELNNKNKSNKSQI